MENQKLVFKDAQQAFREAIERGALSIDRSKPNYAGVYMYMGTWAGVDKFKHSDTREYLREGESA